MYPTEFSITRGDVVAAIGISGPSNRLTRDTMQALAPDVLAIGDRLSRSLGYRGTQPRETLVESVV